MPSDYIDLTYDRIVARTHLAICFEFDGEKRWIPISLIDPDSMPLSEDGDEMGVEAWFVTKEGLEAWES
jgi:hypothetical protein